MGEWGETGRGGQRKGELTLPSYSAGAGRWLLTVSCFITGNPAVYVVLWLMEFVAVASLESQMI